MTASPPRATYRLQLGPDLDLAAAAGLVDYLGDLGVSHLYLSPILAARPGSAHGYDVADPTRVSPALGGESALQALAARARAAGLGLVADVVPNHVGTGAHNPLWDRLLAEGRAGEAARFFDVDWDPPLPGAAGKVIVPLLAAPYGVVLYRGDLTIRDDRLRYHDHSFPLSAESRAQLRRLGGAAAVNGRPGRRETWSRLHALLERQHYRLVHWRAGDALVNYRRFFAINELAGLRVEDDVVFDHTHERILALVGDGTLQGLRIDHPDGLRHPGRYLQRLAQRSGGVWTVVEKILHPGEALADWPVAGTTGYDFCNAVLGLFVDPDAAATLAATDRAFGAAGVGYAAQVTAAKREVLANDLAADTRRLAARLWAVTQTHPEVRDVDDRACLEALSRTLVALDVYRTYVDPDSGPARPDDSARIDAAVVRAADGSLAPAFLHRFLGELLSGRAGRDAAHLDVVARFQQLSGALTAKGVEDTVFYRYLRLLAVNEVGGDPGRLGRSAQEFHAFNAANTGRHPAGMLSTATHDTKRGEDVRLRIAALSELAPRWHAQARRWRQLNRHAVTATGAGPAPDPQTEYLLYQTLVGVWPLQPPGRAGPALRERLRVYAVKAAREAGLRTSWTDPDEGFERALGTFVDTVLDPDRSPAFVQALARLAADAAEIAMVAGLAQTLLRCTSPGVPDQYQGNELWDDSLVDPDNRRPVDFAARRRLLAALDRGGDAAELLAARRDGRVKLWVLSRALRARRDHPSCVGPAGGYRPLAAGGRWADHVVAFARTAPDGDALVAVTPRLPGRVMRGRPQPPLGDAWADTAVELDAGVWTDLLTGARH
ncbi:MAG TPA: malto-oligosyltrehalose synthase, partial [Egibacteraceae bacterium]|nr:malto-oligosyltrehalose synthase [Egibacteraceae bacterium]